MARVVAKRASRLLFVPVKSKRGLPPEELLAVVPGAICHSLAEALDHVKAEEQVVITGSLYLVGEAMELLGVASAPATDERKLNER